MSGGLRSSGLCGVRRRAARDGACACATSSSPRTLVNPDEIHGLDSLVKEAVNLKFIDRPLTAAAARRADPDSAERTK